MSELNKRIIQCNKCPRLLTHCQTIASKKRKAYIKETYWGKPVPNFGKEDAELIIVGLAPAAHGANRTGRMFTGDRSGDWLYRALYKAGFSSQAAASRIGDGLTLKNALVTAACHCAPPDNKPSKEELQNCSMFLHQTFASSQCKVIIALGMIAWNSCIDFAKSVGWHTGHRPKFSHGQEFEFVNGIRIIASYHPSQQNTFTGRLSEAMFDKIFQRAQEQLESAHSKRFD